MHENTFQKRMTNPLEKQIKDLLDLNMKTMQNFMFLNPTELMNTRNPGELFEKHVNLLIQNSHKTLDYIENMFAILENNWQNISDTALEQARLGAQTASAPLVASPQKITKKAAQKTASKSTAKKAKSSAITAKKKTASIKAAPKKTAKKGSAAKKDLELLASSQNKKTDKQEKKAKRSIRLAKKTPSNTLRKKPATKRVLATKSSEPLSKKA